MSILLSVDHVNTEVFETESSRKVDAELEAKRSSPAGREWRQVSSYQSTVCA
jgi:hypothetical protein